MTSEIENLEDDIGLGFPTLLVDANVLASAVKRDIIFSFASANLFTVTWSEEILKETQNALAQIFHRRGIEIELANDRAFNAVNKIVGTFPDSSANITPNTVPEYELPDENDWHVMFAAIYWNADFIVTEDVKDFPSSVLDKINVNRTLEAVNSDEIILKTLEKNLDQCLTVVGNLRQRLQNPALDVTTLLYNWKNRHNLHKTVEFLQQYNNQI